MKKIIVIFLSLSMFVLSAVAFAGHWEKGASYIPYNAFRVGTDVNGTALYLCRSYYKHSLQPGKTWQKYGKCNIPFAGKEVVRTSYSIYIDTGASARHHYRPHKTCVTDNFGNKYCGYNCIKGSGKAICAPKSKEHCVIDSYGNSSCGYGCISTAAGAKCAPHYGEKCVADNFGNIKCGKDCSKNSFGQISCG